MDEKEEKEFKEKFKESMIKEILEYSNIFTDEELDENGNYDYTSYDYIMYLEMYEEEWDTKIKLEKEVMEDDLGIEIEDFEKYLGMSIKDYIELKTLEKKYKENYLQANKEEVKKK